MASITFKFISLFRPSCYNPPVFLSFPKAFKYLSVEWTPRVPLYPRLVMNISDYRRDLASYCSAFELASYQYRAGFEKKLHLEPIYERYSDLFTRDAINDLHNAYRETPADRETERASMRALTSLARIGYMEASARELTDEIARCESSAHVEWNGESLPVNNLPKVMAEESVATRRRELSARWMDARLACDDLRAARIESFHEAARSFGFDSYRALFTEITGTDYERLSASANRFLERTESAYTAALARAVARDLPGVAFDELHYSDYYFFRRLSRLDRFFPAEDLMATYNAAMRSLGIRVEKQPNIYIDSEARPFKNPRAACFPINPPDDVRLLVAPIGGSYDYTVLFHEAGHAQHFAWASPQLCRKHPEFIYAPENATTEGHAFLLNNLLLDAGWLVEHRQGMSLSQAREVVRDLALLMCCEVRRRCGSLDYEIALHEGAQVRSDQLAETFASTVSQATLFRREAAMYLMDVDDGFYTADYLRAWTFEVGFREYLRLRHGRRWWASRRASDELIDLWNTAQRYTVEELASLMGFGEISFDLLADDLLALMKED